MNDTPRAGQAATQIAEHFHELHRGTVRYWPVDTDETFCIALFGNDGYTQREDRDPVIHARTKAYVHNLYAGLANLLPEGAVEFGTDEDGSTWVILAHFPWNDEYDDYRAAQIEDEEDENTGNNLIVDFWDDIVWQQWKSQLAFTEE